MYGDKRSADRAKKEQKHLERKAKRTGRELSGRDKARYQRAEGVTNGLEEVFAYQGNFESEDW
jgi:hypothetical protein